MPILDNNLKKYINLTFDKEFIHRSQIFLFNLKEVQKLHTLKPTRKIPLNLEKTWGNTPGSKVKHTFPNNACLENLCRKCRNLTTFSLLQVDMKELFMSLECINQMS